MGMLPLLQAHHAMERVEEFVCKVRCCKAEGGGHHALVSFPQFAGPVASSACPSGNKEARQAVGGHQETAVISVVASVSVAVSSALTPSVIG